MDRPGLRTQINGEDAEWPPAVRELFERKMAEREPANITLAGYFTPRPWRNEYDRGSKHEGFTYVIDGRHVCIIQWLGEAAHGILGT